MCIRDRYSAVTGTPYGLFLGKSKTLAEYCKENKRIILLGDAGCGKTFELNNIYKEFLDESSSLLPIYVELTYFTGKQDFKDFIPTEYNLSLIHI